MTSPKKTIECLVLELLLSLDWIEDYVYDEIPYVCMDGQWECITSVFKKV